MRKLQNYKIKLLISSITKSANSILKKGLGWSSIGFATILILVTSCFQNAPTYSNVPSIEFSDLCFKTATSSDGSDTLKLVLKFKDGDGDLGLSASDASDNDIPYNEKYYFQKKTDGSLTKVPQNLGTSMLDYNDRRTNSLYSTLPSFVTPYSCTNYEVVTDGNKTSPKILDTLYIEYNPSHYNILIDIYTKNNDGSFTKFDWSKTFKYPNCSVAGYNGRFPILSADLSKKSPLEGLLKYGMSASSGEFVAFFSIKTLKISVQIYDRALNKSNLLETPEFTLQSIKCN